MSKFKAGHIVVAGNPDCVWLITEVFDVNNKCIVHRMGGDNRRLVMTLQDVENACDLVIDMFEVE